MALVLRNSFSSLRPAAAARRPRARAPAVRAVLADPPTPPAASQPGDGRWAPKPLLRSDLPKARVLTAHNVALAAGRLAMLGFVAGVAGELAAGAPLASQLASAEPQWLAAAALVALASAAPLLNGEDEGDEVVGPFEPRAENINGNLALFGVAAMLAIEAVKGSALF